MADALKSREDFTMIQINVVLPNGHAEILTLLPSSTVQDLRTRAQRAFGKKYLKLITAKNRVLVDIEQTLEEAEIEDGECLTALVLQPQLAATRVAAFALWYHGDNEVMTWGQPHHGGDSSAVREQLRGVVQIQATSEAFAAILADGSVVTWGNADSGGDSSAVRDQLKGVLQIQATYGAFAAILEDGSVVSWGDTEHGGDNSAVREQLKGVLQIQATYGAFAAILEDGSVVAWGDTEHGGDNSAIQDELKGVQQVQGTNEAFAAILADGSVVTWGRPDSGGDSWAVRDQLRGVVQIQATGDAFAAILEDGSVMPDRVMTGGFGSLARYSHFPSTFHVWDASRLSAGGFLQKSGAPVQIYSPPLLRDTQNNWTALMEAVARNPSLHFARKFDGKRTLALQRRLDAAPAPGPSARSRGVPLQSNQGWDEAVLDAISRELLEDENLQMFKAFSWQRGGNQLHQHLTRGEVRFSERLATARSFSPQEDSSSGLVAMLRYVLAIRVGLGSTTEMARNKCLFPQTFHSNALTPRVSVQPGFFNTICLAAQSH
eukprot:symbB.v1.2.016175.t1/scaffold1227.1/size245474/2